MTRLLAIGADGAPGGWVAVACRAPERGTASSDRTTELHFFRDIAALATWRAEEDGGETAPVGIDMPIGLPAVVSFRACDRAARDRLGSARASSVFQPPSRRLLACATEPLDGAAPNARGIFERARTLIAEDQARLASEAAPGAEVTVLRRVSQQAAGILGKIAELDAFMQADRDRERWFVEVHPELSLQAMAGGLALPPKTSAHGQLARLELVGQVFPDSDHRIRSWSLGRRYSLLDICDAYAACWSALRWATTDRDEMEPPLEVLGETSPGLAERDPVTGAAMRIVV